MREERRGGRSERNEVQMDEVCGLGGGRRKRARLDFWNLLLGLGDFRGLEDWAKSR